MDKPAFDITKIQTYLDYLYDVDYKERPVSISQFISDPHYLGGKDLTNRGKGIYPCWKEFLINFYSDDAVYIGVLTGAIGVGKSYATCLGLAYGIYRILCLKNPWEYFNLSGDRKMAISFFNLTKTLSASKGFGTLQNFLTKCPWFIESSGGVIKRKQNMDVMEFSLFEYVLSSAYSKGYGTQGHNVLFGMMDEVDDPNESEGQRKRVLGAYNATIRRFISRFASTGESLGKFFLVASKQDEMSFLNVFVEEVKAETRVLIADIPFWEAKPDLNLSGEEFFVQLGDTYTPSKILSDEELGDAVADGNEILSVPVEFLPDFETDIVGALRDIAGVAVVGSRKHKLFPSEKFITACMSTELSSPFERETIEMGVLDDDGVQLWNLFNEQLLKTPKHTPRCIHMDIGFADGGDCLGLAMSGVAGWKKVEREQDDGTFEAVPMPVIRTDFAIRVKPKKNDRVPLHKIRQFVLDLRSHGFNIVQFSADLALASEDTFQILTKKGINTKYMSVDKDVNIYTTYRDLLLEERWECPLLKYVVFELKNLLYYKDKGKVDHPDKVKETIVGDGGEVKTVVLFGSKDVSDGIVGSVHASLKYASSYVDAGKMKELVGSLSGQEVTKENVLDMGWWTDHMTNTGKKETIVEDNTATTFANILKRAR